MVVEVGAEVVVAGREEMERMALVVQGQQAEQAEQAFHSRFLATMGEIPKNMVRVEMVDEIHPLVLQLEQAVRQIQETAAPADLPHLSSHHTPAASGKWVEMAVRVWSLFNIPHKFQGVLKISTS